MPFHELESHIFIPSDRIKVTVRKGWVTLEGDVHWQFQQKLAESAVKKLKGVIGITNNIEVRTQTFSNAGKGQNRGGAAAERRGGCPPC